MSTISGALAGFAGTLIWPTGMLIWMALNYDSGSHIQQLVFLESFLAVAEAMAVGGTIAATLAIAFPYDLKQHDS